MGFKNTFLKIGLNIQRDSDFRLHRITTWSILFIVLDIQMDPDFGDNRGLCHWNMTYKLYMYFVHFNIHSI